MSPSIQDALLYIVQCLRTGRSANDGYATYGYELYVPNVVRNFYREHTRLDLPEGSREQLSLAPAFLDAAWELCRRGILRPGVKNLTLQATGDGSAGSGFSVTEFGRAWLQEKEHDTFVPTEPERFGKILAPYKEKYGAGFHERAQQAVRCYGAHAYLACCAMCGAAAESIMLAAATARAGQDEVAKLSRAANGRSKIENVVVGHVDDRIRRELQSFTSLLKYWRDLSAHGHASNIDDNEAFTSMALLLRLAASVSDNWEAITRA